MGLVLKQLTPFQFILWYYVYSTYFRIYKFILHIKAHNIIIKIKQGAIHIYSESLYSFHMYIVYNISEWCGKF